ncbi:FtsX-like permease family protein [Tissierella sp.]|uniref:ABC transporter permease n=1 Tax=Tissierella sp. TaxID=41274 RepID=UPI00285BC62B|nr:FtsX-like permease family protein [Tissierella sp.]MDR7856811.1 FtsX-like permease family protein [Tissierella sp.]
MNKFFYPKLALNNIKKNSRAYIPYLLTCIGTIIMFYNMCYLVVVKDLGYLSDSGTLRYMMLLGTIIVGIFSFFFLYYTNSFLIKQRKKEFGLFNILGMEKRHIGKIMLYETLYISIISLISGILGGILLSKLLALLLLKLIKFDVVFGFEIPLIALVATIILFSAIFLFNLIYNVLQVHLSKPIELLKGGNVGEREPKTKWFSTIIGIVSLGIGYYLALTADSPIAAINKFFIAVIFVIIGTNFLFKAGSIALLKSLRKNKNYYYQTNHFISVSGMIYRMKQNAAGLANICILSTAVIITLSTTVSLYVGVDDLLRTRYPRNIEINASYSEEVVEKLDDLVAESTMKANVSSENVTKFSSISFMTNQKGSSFMVQDKESFSMKNLSLLILLTQDDYNRLEGKGVSLEEGEVLVYTAKGEISGDVMDLNGFELNIKEKLDSFNMATDDMAHLSDSHYIVVDSLATINKTYSHLEGDSDAPELNYYYGFDVETDSSSEIELAASIRSSIDKANIDAGVKSAESDKETFYTLYGGLFFLGIFIGILFIMATVLIIYYKQIAEGFDDKDRFEIMQKVGMSRKEIKQSIRSQVLTVFFLPLVTSVIHVAFAFKVVTEMLSIFYLTNVSLYALYTGLTIIVFAFFYIIIYTLTARTYYKIVS